MRSGPLNYRLPWLRFFVAGVLFFSGFLFIGGTSPFGLPNGALSAWGKLSAAEGTSLPGGQIGKADGLLRTDFVSMKGTNEKGGLSLANPGAQSPKPALLLAGEGDRPAVVGPAPDPGPTADTGRGIPSFSSGPIRLQGSAAGSAPAQGRPARQEPAQEANDTLQTNPAFLNGPFGMKASIYRYPQERLRGPWMECRVALETGSLNELQSSLNRLYEARLDTGFPNAPGVAALLLREGYRAMERGDMETAGLLGQSAQDLAPDFYPVYDFVSRLAVRDDRQGWGQALMGRWESFTQRWRLFEWQYAFAGRVYLLLLFSFFLFFLFLGPCFLLRYGTLYLHALRERLKPGGQGRLQQVALGILCVTLLVLLPGPLWGGIILGLLLGRFLSRWERALFAAGMLLLALSPITLREASRFLSRPAPAGRVLCECMRGDWDASCDRDLETALADQPNSPDLLLTHALVEKRRGEFARAADILQGALKHHPENGFLWNNLGNLLAFQGDLAAAKDGYARAIHWNPGSAPPHHNLSQLLRREFSFIEGGRAFQEARRIDPARVDYFSYIHSQNPNRFFMDETPTVASCWRHALAGDGDADTLPSTLWIVAGSGIPLDWAPWLFGPLAGLALLLPTVRKWHQRPLHCTGCGVVVCGKCHSGTAMTKMCTPCYQVLYAGKDIPKERRSLQIRKMARNRTVRLRRLLLLNALLPGLGFSLYKDRVSGYLLLFLFLFLAVAGLFWVNFLPLPVVAWETGGATCSVLFSGALLALYGIVQVRFYLAIRSGR